MFEEATKNKYRFPSNVGMINVEDLWDLPASHLDTIYKKLNKQLKQSEEESLLVVTSAADKELEDKIAIVKHIFLAKALEADERLHAKERKEKKQYLLSLLQQKQDETYKSKSVEELQELINAL